MANGHRELAINEATILLYSSVVITQKSCSPREKCYMSWINLSLERDTSCIPSWRNVSKIWKLPESCQKDHEVYQISMINVIWE